MKKTLLSLFFIVFTCAILDRTYYKALKIPISADQEQIRTAFRKLSRKYHPDRNPNAKSKFEKINVAYETLSNEETKYLYDRVGREKMVNPNIQNEVNLHELKGTDLEIPLILTLEDLYQGKIIQSTIFKRMACPHCLGSGAQNQYDIVRCSECQGQGKKVKRVHVGGGYYNMMNEQCPRCKGEGKIIGRKCETCGGGKLVSGSQEFEIKIEPGTRNYDTIKFINMGEERMQGAPGDLTIRIRQAAHRNFTRMGDQLHTNIYISLQQALFGFTRTIYQLDGRELKVEKTAISQPNQVIILQGQGMPIKQTGQKSSMHVRINVQIPQYNKSQLQTLQQTFMNL